MEAVPADGGGAGFRLPPRPRARGGALRRVGVELEMTGLALDELAARVRDHTGGTVREPGRYEREVTGDPLGEWRVELDVTFLKERGREPAGGALEEAAEALLHLAARRIAPMEVVSPPIPLDRLAGVDRLVARLREAGARGTTEALVYAFGLQLNPELPDLEAATVTAYLRAFLCLYDWLLRESRVDLARRLTPFVDPFPRDYVRRVVDPGYQPEVPALMDDYLADNPTRNRALDLLPLFAELDPERLRRHLDDPKVKARPTLHYRLPNCEIDRPGWGVAVAWRHWLQVEHLAADPRRLEELARRYAEWLDRPLGGVLEDWAEEVTAWLVAPEDL